MTAAVHAGRVDRLAWPWFASRTLAAQPPPPAPSADAALVAAAAAGSSGAFARLVERHQQALRAFLRRVCRDWALADDLAQETFLTAWSRLGGLSSDANVGAWLCGIAYRKHLTHLRGASRSARREADWRQIASGDARPNLDDRLTLGAAMTDLPAEQRACVALCLAAEFSHAEAAAALGLPLGTVKSHVARGRARLLSALEYDR
jgi:RNA polymerase sigma-70 factor (ECF subfamily)